jgi:ubiquinone/menaquinone biosynthesis C-methylase UbiE
VTPEAEPWERFARDDPLFFIETDPAKRDSLDAFYEGGQQIAAWAVDFAGPGLGRQSALEIGCGVGRVVLALAESFEEAYGVDIAPTMIHRARQHGVPKNVVLSVVAGDGRLDFKDRAFDLVFSHLVFQHVTSAEVIARYLAETARVLRLEGRALFQFDTRSRSALEPLVHALPDVVLPRRYRRHIRRTRRRPELIDSLEERAGLELARERGRGTGYDWRLLKLRRHPT